MKINKHSCTSVEAQNVFLSVIDDKIQKGPFYVIPLPHTSVSQLRFVIQGTNFSSCTMAFACYESEAQIEEILNFIDEVLKYFFLIISM